MGGLGLLCVLFSVGGQSFVAPFFTAPQGQCCVFSLLGCRGWAIRWAQTQVCGDDAAVVVEGQCQSVDALPPFSASCSSLWVAGVLGLCFRGMGFIHRASEYSSPANHGAEGKEGCGEEWWPRSIGRRDARRRVTGQHRTRKWSSNQAGVLSRGGSVSRKYQIRCEPAV